MTRIVVELTNRCNLKCGHCFEERHAATGDLDLSIIKKLIDGARSCGIDEFAFTGGEPTVHREFREIIHTVCDANYRFGLVSNGTNFPKVYPLLVECAEQLTAITFSLDGARESTHDHLRGSGSYRRVMRAASICVAKDIRFSLNMVVTAHNRDEIAEAIELAASLGSAGLRFGYLMFTPTTAANELNLSPGECREVGTQIRQLQVNAPLPVGMGPGFFSESPFYPCGPLELEEFNVNYKGDVTLCCQLSGLAGPHSDADVIGNLNETGLMELHQRLRQRVATYLSDKRARIQQGDFAELDHFPCFYCAKYMNKIPELEPDAGHPWGRLQTRSKARSINVQFGSEDTAAS